MIKLENIHKTFYPGTVNENKSINGLNLTIEREDFVTIIGSNGAGKSTLMNLLAGSLTADSGKIEIDGIDVTYTSEHQRAKWIGRVFQDPMKGTASSLTIEENLALAMKRTLPRNLTKAVKASYLQQFKDELAKLNLGLENRLQDIIGLLSGGQRQSITLLMSSLVKPHIILLDEHTAALDPKTAKTVMELTRDIIKDHRLTAIMITHNMEQAIKYGNRIVMLHKGRVAFDLKGEERTKQTSSSLLARFSQVCAEDEL